MVGDLSPLEKRGQGQVLFLYPKSDHNHAGSYGRTFCQRLMCWYDRGNDVYVRRIFTVREGTEIINRYNDGGISDIILGGHGSPKGMTFGRGHLRVPRAGTDTFSLFPNVNSNLSSSDTEAFFKALNSKLAPWGSVTLESCSTAGECVGDNFYTYVGKVLPGRTITAASDGVSKGMWKKPDNERGLCGDTADIVSYGKKIHQRRPASTARPHHSQLVPSG